MADGSALYRLVEEYAALGDHRTGTDVDHATRAWFAAALEARGADVEEVPYDFERDATVARLAVDGDDVTVLPLLYAGSGRVAVDDPLVVGVEVLDGVLPVGLDEAATQAGADGAAAVVLATDAPGGRLVAVNRRPERGDGIPAVLAPGSVLGSSARLRLDVDCRLVDGRSATVVGRLGRGSDPVVVTTPLTGWFACAGERGTGVAVALDLAERLAAHHAVTVVGTTGHELEHLGLRRWLADDGDAVAGYPVVHLGASVAAGDPGPAGVELSHRRFALTNLDGRLGDLLGERLAPAALPILAGLPAWPGEGEDWRATGAAVLSFTGAFERFHTPDDVPAAVTAPALLGCVADAVADAAAVLLGRAG